MREMPVDDGKKLCPRCMRSLKYSEFYKSRSGEYAMLCKKCLTAHVDNYDPKTFVPILEELDIPFVKEEWNILLDRAVKSGKPITGTTVFGRYLAKMRLNQWKNYSYADTEKLQAEKDAQIEADKARIEEYETQMKAKFEKGEISEQEYQIAINHGELESPPEPEPPTREEVVGEDNAYPDGVFMSEDSLPDLALDLTEEDKIYLAMKWGRMYKPDEWINLEKKYSEMKESFDISDSDTEGTLILICKTYLKMNQAIN